MSGNCGANQCPHAEHRVGVLGPVQFQELHTQLRQSGGFTVDPKTGQQPSSGVAVALSQHERVLEGATAADVGHYGADKADALQAPGAHIGGWYDAEGSGKDFLDVSMVHPGEAISPMGRGMAIVKSAEHNQLAAYDLGNGVTVDNPYHGAKYPDEFNARVKADYDDAASGYRAPRATRK